jgi:VanZ family protein
MNLSFATFAFFPRDFVFQSRWTLKRKSTKTMPMCSPSACQNRSGPVYNFIRYWLPVLVWMALIFTASADAKSYQHSSTLFEPLLHWLFPQMSPPTVERLHHLFRKSGHLTEYAVLALILWRAIHQPDEKNPRAWRWDEAGLALAVVFLYAASDEFHQIFVPSRTPLVSDVMIDTLGGAAGLLLLWTGGKLFKPRPR